MTRINLENAPKGSGTRYPAPFADPCLRRQWLRLGDAAGLTQFGVNLVTLEPGVWSSQRHWHSHEDEFIYLLEGELVLVTDAGEELMRAGDAAGFKAGERNGHHLQNRADRAARMLVVGARNAADSGEYPDLDLKFGGDRYSGKGGYTHRDGTPY